jgi:hypothetical protein
MCALQGCEDMQFLGQQIIILLNVYVEAKRGQLWHRLRLLLTSVYKYSILISHSISFHDYNLQSRYLDTPAFVVAFCNLHVTVHTQPATTQGGFDRHSDQ